MLSRRRDSSRRWPGETRTTGSSARGLHAWPAIQPAAQAPGAFTGSFDRDRATELARKTVDRLRSAKRPVILAGSALRAVED